MKIDAQLSNCIWCGFDEYKTCYLLGLIELYVDDVCDIGWNWLKWMQIRDVDEIYADQVRDVRNLKNVN